MKTIKINRYVTPLREGGSLPAVMEGEDKKLYVVKFRGAAQGCKALIAELLAGEFARELDLPMPRLVLADLQADLARTEPDPQIQALLRASAGLNLAMEYLPGAVTFDPLVHQLEADLASRIVWHDAFVTNVDRTARNSNLLMWKRGPWLIDHGAAMYFHHNWPDFLARSTTPFSLIKDHVLLGQASRIMELDADIERRLTSTTVARIVDLIPDEWLEPEASFASKSEHRAAYGLYFTKRLASPRAFAMEAAGARSVRV